MELHTERLLLREFRAEDWEALLAYQSQPEYLRYYPWTDRSAEEAQAFVNVFVRRQHEVPRIKFQLAIQLKATGQMIGNCGVRMDTPDSVQGDMGYELAHAHWGQGYATEAARAILRFGFTELRLHRIWADCIAENVASARVLTKIGMQQEGYLRETQFFKGRWWDERVFAILVHEWEVLAT